VAISIIITVNQLAQQQINPTNAVIVVIIYGLLGFLFFQVGKERPPNKSWLHAVGGWLFGFASALIALYGSVLALYYILFGTLP
jgi:TctA family transporter